MSIKKKGFILAFLILVFVGVSHANGWISEEHLEVFYGLTAVLFVIVPFLEEE